ncbi:hypothetical protein [Oceanithermus profundus]|uniref:Uncharacterized protein n=1 Tax=Oceanithermus profundus (strain DSM 14977 / NBRC 100410 / VKM B-2274 / 506) TaxID=670487 RepID=E4U465_OCEP5|nr:hypothetical protein [Oceanithermus profundus]ADR36150.1 hypothetical protein Ocepr_0692 [Oceanithermus profundus DSM 14977]
MKLYLVTNVLRSGAGPVVESVYVVAAENEEEARGKARGKARTELLEQRVRSVVFDHEGTALVWMGAPQTGEAEHRSGRTKKESGMRDGR